MMSLRLAECALRPRPPIPFLCSGIARLNVGSASPLSRTILANASTARRTFTSLPRGLTQLGLQAWRRPTAAPVSTSSSSSLTQSSPILRFLRKQPRFFSSTPPSLFSRTPPSGLPRYTPGGHNYRGGPPRSNGFIDWDRLSPDRLIWAIIIGNVLIFLTWQVAATNYRSGDPSLLASMYKNWTGSWENLKAGRVWTLVTSAFSHSEMGHLFMNMFTFYFMGSAVAQMLGPKHFLTLYLFSAVTSCLGSIAWESYVGRNSRGLGASGAIDAVLGFLACAAPRMTFMIYGIIPVPAWLAVGGFFAYDVYGTAMDNRPGVGTAAHVTGILTGIAWYLVLFA